MAADAVHGEAIDVYDTFESAGDYSSEAALEADAMCEAACDCAMDVAWQLAITAPTTLGGVEAVLRFAKPRRLQREHGKWPSSGPKNMRALELSAKRSQKWFTVSLEQLIVNRLLALAGLVSMQV